MVLTLTHVHPLIVHVTHTTVWAICTAWTCKYTKGNYSYICKKAMRFRIWLHVVLYLTFLLTNMTTCFLEQYGVENCQ